MKRNLKHDREAGFTLIEMLIVMVISSVLMGAVLSLFIQYVNTSAQQSAQDDINAEVSSLFKVIEKDVMMAGYGLPARTKIASHFNCIAADPAFCVNNTDRLFVADGWQILRAVTDNNEDDGQIAANFMTFIANRKSSAAGGYSTTVKADIGTGINTMTLLALNINSGEELTVSATDFSADNALIIGDNARVEGHAIRIVTPPDTVETMALDPVIQPYLAAVDHSVVPATVWYVRNDPDGKTFSDGSPVNWLYRNGFKVLPNVSNFKVKYGYDTKNDGIQWSDTVPPTNNGVVGGKYDDSWAPTPDGGAYVFSSLKLIQITLTVKSVYKTAVKSTPYQTAILLRN